VGYIRVSPAFSTNEYISPIALSENDPQEGDYVTIMGWGATRDGGPVSDHLFYAPDMRVIADEDADVFSDPIPPYEQIFCIFERQGTCGGDSGKILVISLAMKLRIFLRWSGG